MKYLIKDGLVLSSKISNGFYKSHVLIEDDVISYIGQSIPATQVDRVIEAKDCLVIPGLVNAHLHSADHFNKGKFDNLPLELWMPLLRPFYSGIGNMPLHFLHHKKFRCYCYSSDLAMLIHATGNMPDWRIVELPKHQFYQFDVPTLTLKKYMPMIFCSSRAYQSLA